MRPVVVVGPLRADPDVVDALAGFGVATVHEAMGRSGLLGTELRPVRAGSAVGGTAVTVVCPPGDNLMVHVAVEQIEPGDILVVTTTSPSSDGFIGELIVTSLVAHGARAIVTTTGVRDVAEIARMGFPLWSRSVSAQGTVKATAGAVNVPVSIDGTLISAGDVIVADDDGVLCVPRRVAAGIVGLASARVESERRSREALARGELGLDIHGLRSRVAELGVTYITAGDDESR